MDDIARFGAYLSDEKHSSRNTVSSYLRDTTQFAEYLHNYCDIDLREADSAAVQDYMDWMLSHGKSAASVTRFRSRTRVSARRTSASSKGSWAQLNNTA